MPHCHEIVEHADLSPRRVQSAILETSMYPFGDRARV
jgi:hypothetical protein